MREVDVAIIGAGIIGICAAASLAETDRSVTVFDRTGICEETSSGNAAALAFPDILPLAQKGMMRNLPRWLADPLGPLSIPPSYFPKLAPWLWRFWRAGSPRHYEKSLAAQSSLMRLAEAEWMRLLQASDTRSMLREDGALELYESEAEFTASLPGWQARQQYGFEFRHVAGGEMATLQPGLSPRFVKGTFMPGWKNVADPKLLGKAVFEHARRRGKVAFEQRRVQAIAQRDGGAMLRLADGEEVLCRRRVVTSACGAAWRQYPAGDRARLQHYAAYRCFRREAAIDLLIPRLRRHAASNRLAYRRRGRTWRTGTAAGLSSGEGDAGKDAAIPAGSENRGWARVDGVSTVATGFAPRYRKVARLGRDILCLRPRSSWADAGGGDGQARARSRGRSLPRNRSRTLFTAEILRP